MKALKRLLTLTPLLLFCVSMTDAQTMSLDQWNKEAQTNIRLIPKYGHAQKSEAQNKADKDFIETALAQDTTNRKASDRFIRLGFKYLHSDIKIAMYRFNQAYLLDSTNSDIYWGFAAVYMVLADYARAEQQFVEGLAVNPNNTHLLTDYGTYFLMQYYGLTSQDSTAALANLEHGINNLLKSYALDSKDQNTSFKLSLCYLIKGDCNNAQKYYNICKSLGGQPVTEEFIKDLLSKCGQ